MHSLRNDDDDSVYYCILYALKYINSQRYEIIAFLNFIYVVLRVDLLQNKFWIIAEF